MLVTTPDETEEAAPPAPDTDATEDISILLAEEEFDLAEATGGRYVYRGEICTGGMGRVVRAWDTRLERPVAVKILRSTHVLKPDLSGRFVCEAKITANLIHPGVVPVYDVGCDARGRHFFVMQYIEGTTLADLIAATYQRNPPSFQAIHHLLGLFIRVCQTIGYAHFRGIIHRDLKPANVMVGNFGETLVMDWGLAKCVQPEQWPGLGFSGADGRKPPAVAGSSGRVCAPENTEDKRIRGTPRYMSPEQAGAPHAANIGPASDVFSLGIVLYEILTGEKPFVGDSVRTILEAVRAANYRPIHEVLRENKRRPIAPELQAICEKALALRPEDRYPTARELAADLEAYYEHRAVSAYRESLYHRLRRLSRRYPVAAVVVMLAFVGILGISAAAAVYYYATTRMARPFALQEAAGRKEYQAIRNELQWLSLQKSRCSKESPEAAEIEKQIRKLEKRRFLAADLMLFAQQRIFAMLRWKRDPEAYRKFRRVWLAEMIHGIDIGEYDIVLQRYQQMLTERRFPWWRWEPEEFPRLVYLRNRLQEHFRKRFLAGDSTTAALSANPPDSSSGETSFPARRKFRSPQPRPASPISKSGEGPPR